MPSSMESELFLLPLAVVEAVFVFVAYVIALRFPEQPLDLFTVPVGLIIGLAAITASSRRNK